MTAADSWFLVVAGYAIMLAWPVSTLALVSFAVRYVASHRTAAVSAALEHGDGTPQHFWIIVPALNEEVVVGNTVHAALGLSGPGGTLARVLVVDDGSDDRTPEVLAAIDHPRLQVLRRDLPEARKGKGEALNNAFRVIRDITLAEGLDPRRVAMGVIDGDGRGSANLLTEVARAMRAADVGAVQARVRIHNRQSVLAAVQDLEFAAIANASQLLRDAAGTVGLGGNGQFARLSSLIRLGDAPWSACLVEDLELGLRMHLGGDRIRYTSQGNVSQQGLTDVKRLLRQRTRWAQGNLQCISYVPRLIASRNIRNHALVEMLYYLLAPWLNAFGIIGIASLWGYAAWRLLPGNGPAFLIHTWVELASAMGVWVAGMTLPGFLWATVHRFQLHDEKLSRLYLAALAYPMFLMLGIVSTWRAIGRQLTKKQTWAKTERLAEAPLATAA